MGPGLRRDDDWVGENFVNKVVLVSIATAALAAAAPAAATDCAALSGVALTRAEVTAAGIVPANTAPLPLPVEICRVAVTARPSADSDVRLELWIPQGAAWNGKFVQVGNGGFAGKIPYRTMALALRGGYAVAGTDTGHQTPGDDIDTKWALGHPEKLVDFGWRSIKTTTDAAKALLGAYAGIAPKKAYFFGCSDGGREALMTAQRYPADFDAIVAGAPAYDWTALMATAGLIGKTVAAPERALPPAKLPALQAAALAACGKGGQWIADPQACRFDPVVIACKGAETDQCLTPGQVATVRIVYRGTIDPATKQSLPGLRPGAEAQPGAWGAWSVGAGAKGDAAGFADSYFGNIVRQKPGFKLAGLTTADLAASRRDHAATLNATSPDLSAFRARGGRLIQYHGWNDPAISPEFSLRYAAALHATLGDTRDFYRLYMVPGMLHCTGGASPTGINWLKLLDDWSAGGTAPETIVAAAADGRTQQVSPQALPVGRRAMSR